MSSDLDGLLSTHCFMSSMVKLVRSGTSSSSTSGSSSSSSSTTGEAAGAAEHVSANVFSNREMSSDEKLQLGLDRDRQTLTGAGGGGGGGVGLRRLDDACGDEFGQQVVDIHLTEVVLRGDDLRSCRDTRDRRSQVCGHQVL